MPRSVNSWTFIDKLERDPLLLQDSDVCYYYLTRTSGGYLESEANSRIENFKKEPEKYRNRPEVWKYKEEQVRCFADDVCDLIETGNFRRMLSSFPDAAIVPIPTSKPKSHEYYDSRLGDMCKIIASRIDGLEYADPFDMREAVRPSHHGGPRDIDFLKTVITFSSFEGFVPSLVIVIDDVLTSGSHYIACRDLIHDRYPSATIIGLFLSIHKPEPTEYAVVEFELS